MVKIRFKLPLQMALFCWLDLYKPIMGFLCFRKTASFRYTAQRLTGGCDCAEQHIGTSVKEQFAWKTSAWALTFGLKRTKGWLKWRRLDVDISSKVGSLCAFMHYAEQGCNWGVERISQACRNTQATKQPPKREWVCKGISGTKSYKYTTI